MSTSMRSPLEDDEQGATLLRRRVEPASANGRRPLQVGGDLARSGVSVVMPVYNERDNVEPAAREVLAVLDGLVSPAELIVVDDGSTDGTGDVLAALAAELAGPRGDGAALRVVRLRRNFGQTAALSAGIDRACGQSVVLIDGDQQNDPADIPRLLEGLADGYDVVSGWRARRQDPLVLRRLPSRCANALISRVTGVALHDYGCTLKAYDADVLTSIRLYGEQHRFIPALASMHGARVLEVAVNHRPRTRGSSKYGISRLPRVLADLLTLKMLLGYRARPMQLFAKAALGCVAAATVPAIAQLGFAVARGRPEPASAPGRAPRRALAGPAGPRSRRGAGSLSLLACGVQLLGIGLLAELVTRVWHEPAGRSTYVVASTEGFDSPWPRAAASDAGEAGVRKERSGATATR